VLLLLLLLLLFRVSSLGEGIPAVVATVVVAVVMVAVNCKVGTKNRMRRYSYILFIGRRPHSRQKSGEILEIIPETVYGRITHCCVIVNVFAFNIYELSLLGADHPETLKTLHHLIEKKRVVMGEVTLALAYGQLNCKWSKQSGNGDAFYRYGCVLRISMNVFFWEIPTTPEIMGMQSCHTYTIV
jgi:hypothetical protein